MDIKKKEQGVFPIGLVALVVVLLIGGWLFFLPGDAPESKNQDLVAGTEESDQSLSFEDIRVDYQNTDLWSRFSFTSFALNLPTDWEVSSIDKQHKQVILKNNPVMARRYDVDVDDISLKIVLGIEDEKNINSEPFKVDGFVAKKTVIDDKQIVYVDNTKQKISYVFKFENSSNEEFSDRVMQTVSFHTRDTLGYLGF